MKFLLSCVLFPLYSSLHELVQFFSLKIKQKGKTLFHAFNTFLFFNIRRYLIISAIMSSTSSSASNSTSEGSCASGGSGVESKDSSAAPAAAVVDSTATSSMATYGSTYTTGAGGQLTRDYSGTQ
jgi:hypothetical protein